MEGKIYSVVLVSAPGTGASGTASGGGIKASVFYEFRSHVGITHNQPNTRLSHKKVNKSTH